MAIRVRMFDMDDDSCADIYARIACNVGHQSQSIRYRGTFMLGTFRTE